MIRTTLNETGKTMTRTIVGSTYEVVSGSPDGIEADAVTELNEIEYLALGVGATYSVVPSDEHWTG